jgi:hypothetical protein
VIVLAVLLPAGAAWVAVLSSINATIQLFLPNWVRGRGLAIYQIVFAAGQAGGAVAWGLLTDYTSLVLTMLVAAATMLAGAATVRRWPLRETRHWGRQPAVYWQDPALAVRPDPHSGPILVEISYPVAPENAERFTAAMRAVRRTRQRTGASRWGLFRHGERPDTFVEVYLVPSWDEHLRQHYGRLTEEDQAVEQAARALTCGPSKVSHLFAADSLPTPVPTSPLGAETVPEPDPPPAAADADRPEPGRSRTTVNR